MALALLLLGCGAAGDATPDTASKPPAARAARPEPARPQSFTVQVTGSGPPVILIPGLASSGETWSSTVAHLRARRTCHVLTLAGFAGVPPSKGPLMARVRDELAAYIEQHELDHPVVIGHSLGGTLALDLAARHPGRVGPLVIVDSLPFLAGPWMQADSLAAARPGLEKMRASVTAWTPAQYQAFARSGAATRYMVTSPENLKKVIEWGVASDATTVGNAMMEMLGTDLRADLARIDSPALVLGTWIGLRDQLAASGQPATREQIVKVFRDQYAGLERMRFAMSDGARHFIMLDDPRWFFAQLDSFLADPAAAVRDRGFSR